MAGKNALVRVNGEAILNYIKNHMGITMSQASLKIGYSEGYMSKVCRSDMATDKAIMLMRGVLGIPDDCIMPKDEMQEKRRQEEKEAERIRFFEDCEQKLENAVLSIDSMLTMIDGFVSMREKLSENMGQLMEMHEIYQNTVERLKGE